MTLHWHHRRASKCHANITGERQNVTLTSLVLTLNIKHNQIFTSTRGCQFLYHFNLLLQFVSILWAQSKVWATGEVGRKGGGVSACVTEFSPRARCTLRSTKTTERLLCTNQMHCVCDKHNTAELAEHMTKMSAGPSCFCDIWRTASQNPDNPNLVFRYEKEKRKFWPLHPKDLLRLKSSSFSADTGPLGFRTEKKKQFCTFFHGFCVIMRCYGVSFRCCRYGKRSDDDISDFLEKRRLMRYGKRDMEDVSYDVTLWRDVFRQHLNHEIFLRPSSVPNRLSVLEFAQLKIPHNSNNNWWETHLNCACTYTVQVLLMTDTQEKQKRHRIAKFYRQGDLSKKKTA